MPFKARRSKRKQSALPLHGTDGGYWPLVFGCDLFNDGSPPLDEPQMRAAWRLHRDEILATWDRPGARPDAFWRYERDWPAGAVGQAHAVRLLPDTSAEERAAIERRWLHRIEIAFLHAAKPEFARGL